MSAQLYTQDQLDIALLKQKNDSFGQSLERIFTKLDSIDSRIDNLNSALDSKINWIVGVSGTGFITLLGLIAHGFHWAGL